MTDISNDLRGGLPPEDFTTWNPIAAVTMPACTPVSMSADPAEEGMVVPAIAEPNRFGHVNQRFVVGLCVRPARSGFPVNVKYAGPFSQDLDSWALVTGNPAGLIPGAQYFLDPATPGKITNQQPTTSNEFIVPLGIAINPTALFIGLTAPIPIP